MRPVLLFILGAISGFVLAALPAVSAHLHILMSAIHGNRASQNGVRAHTEEKFTFTAHGPIDRVAPLMGADKERAWAPKWDPQFIHPSPAVDVPGMVFTVAHHHLQAAWVCTEFDLANGHVQYVYVIPDIMLTMITLKLQPDANQTQVEVEYDRTALSPEADARVREMAQQDRASGPEWERQINQYLK
jgi:hypothetical protein